MYSQIASNKRRSVLFIGVFFVIWIAIGALGGLLFVAFSHREQYQRQRPPRPPPATASARSTSGMVICAILALLGVVYSLTAGAALVLRVSGAEPADPVRYQQIHDLVESLAIGEGIPKPAVYVIDDPSPNAFATGVSPDKAAITYTTGLLAIMNREELEGVTGHEMSHIKNHDIRLLLVVGTMIGMAALLASILWRSAFFSSMGRGRDSGNIGLILIVLGALLAVVGLHLRPADPTRAVAAARVARRRERVSSSPGTPPGCSAPSRSSSRTTCRSRR